MLESMKNFVKENNTCVLATCLDHQPHCSLMAYAPDTEGTTLFMITQTQTKKFRNMEQNDRVSLLIDSRVRAVQDGSRPQALTVSGRYQPVTDVQEAEKIRRRIVETHPHLKNLADAPEAQVIAVKAVSFLWLKGPEEAYFEVLA